MLRAIDTVRQNKQQYAEAEPRARHPNRPTFFDPMSALAAVAIEHDLSEGMSADMAFGFGGAQVVGMLRSAGSGSGEADHGSG